MMSANRNINNEDVTLPDNSATQTLTLSAASNQFIIAPNNGAKYTFTAANPSADRVYTISDSGANDTLVLLNAQQTLTNKLLENLNALNTASNIESNISGDTQLRYTQNVDGSQLFGDGLNAQDVCLLRNTNGSLAVDNTTGGTAQISVDKIIALQTNGNLNLNPSGTGNVWVNSNGLKIQNSSLTSYTPAALNTYSYDTINISFSGPFTQSAAILATRVGKLCTLTFPVIQAASSVSALLTGGNLPSNYLPAYGCKMPCRVYNSGTTSVNPGLFYVSTSGSMTFAADMTNSSFSSSGTVGPFSFMVSWIALN